MTHVPIWWDSSELCQKQASNVRFFFVRLHTELSSVYSFRQDFFLCAIPSLISEQLSEECQENRELIQRAASRSPLTVKIELMWDPASETKTEDHSTEGLKNVVIHSIKMAFFSRSFCAVSNGFLIPLKILSLNAALLLVWGAQHSILPWHLACQQDPESLAVLRLPEKRNNRYLETIKQHSCTNKDDIKFSWTHWFTNRSNRADFTLFTAFALWGEGKDTHQKRREPRGAKHIAHTVRTVFPADPSVPGRPGCPASPWEDSGFAIITVLNAKINGGQQNN